MVDACLFYPIVHHYSPVGSVANITGATACISCEPGTAVAMMNNPQAYCQPCAPGMFAVSSSSQQVSIHTLNLDTKFYLIYRYCLPRFIFIQCDNCGVNTYAPNTHASTCFLCPSFSSAQIASTECACSAGVIILLGVLHVDVYSNIVVIASILGYLRNDTTGLCTACPIGSFFQPGSTTRNATCGLCPTGSISNFAGSLECTRMDIFCLCYGSIVSKSVLKVILFVI